MECTSNRKALLTLIQPNMKLTKEFLKRTYAFNMDYPGFSEEAISALEAAGYSKARQYYESWVNEYEAAYNAELDKAAHWYRQECEREWAKKQKGSEEKRKQIERKQTSRKWMDGLY